MIPPLLILIRTEWLWLPVPLFLLWPFYVIGLAIAIVVMPLIPMRSMTMRQRVLLPIWFAGVVNAFRGLIVDVGESGGERVYVRII